MKHGTRNAYVHLMCSCARCRAANAKYHRQLRDCRIERLANGDPTAQPQHGRLSTYNNWGCRCAECSSAHRAYYTAKRDARKAREVAS